MDSKTSIEVAAERLNKALESLEVLIGTHQTSRKAANAMQDELQIIAQDRSQQAQRIDQLTKQNVHLEQVNVGVQHKLAKSISTLEQIITKAESQRN